MPAMDKTDPVGRGLGRCQEEDASANRQGYGRGGRGFGRRGGGRGFGGECRRGGRFGPAPLTDEEQVAMLETRISAMEARLKALQGKSTS